MVSTWEPPHLLKPPSCIGDFDFGEECVTCDIGLYTEMGAKIKKVYVTTDAVVFVDEEGRPYFQKQLSLLDRLRLPRHVEDRVSVILHERANVWGDVTVEINFPTSIQAHNCVEAIRTNFVACTLPTKIYLLDDQDDTPSSEGSSPSLTSHGSVSHSASSDSGSSSESLDTNSEASLGLSTSSDGLHVGRAKLLNNGHLHKVITSVLTSLAYTNSAAILGPIINWDVRPGATTTAIIAKVHTFFRAQPPPPIIILNKASDLSDCILYHDGNPHNIASLRALPCPPTWPGPGSPPSSWVKYPISNYRMHIRGDTPLYIALSHELVDFYLATVAAFQSGGTQMARESLEAATASLKLTLIHEFAHLIVTSRDQTSPARSSVKGAENAQYIYAEDVDNPDVIEAGLLVETAWLGRPHGLVLDQDGWLRLAIELAVPEPEKQPSSPPTSQPSSPPTSQPSSRPTSPMPTKDALYYQVDEANIPGGVLGSPIHLVSPRTSPTPAASPPYTSTLATLFGPTNSIQLCDVDLVARFSEPQLPSLPYGLFNQGQTQTVVTPSRRSKNASPIRPRLASSTVHTPPPATLDNIPRGVLIGGYMPIVPAVDGRTTKRWPRVWYPPNGVRPKS